MYTMPTYIYLCSHTIPSQKVQDCIQDEGNMPITGKIHHRPHVGMLVAMQPHERHDVVVEADGTHRNIAEGCHGGIQALAKL